MNKKILFLGRESVLWLGLDEKQKNIESKQSYSDEMSYVIDVMKKNSIDFKTHFFERGSDFSELLNIFKESGADIVFSDFYSNLANGEKEKWIFDELKKLGIPHYLSSDDTMKLMYNKILCQKKLENSGIEVLPFMSVDVNNFDSLDKFLKKHKKVILKPAQGYSSIGIAVFDEIDMAINHSTNLKKDGIIIKVNGKTYNIKVNDIIAEKFLEDKKEYQILIIGRKPDLYPVEVGIPLGKVYDRVMKEEHFSRDAVKSLDIYDNLIKLGKIIHDTIGIRDLARIDVISDSDNNLYPIDVNGIPYLAKINPNNEENASLTQIGKIYNKSYESLIMEILGLH
jgi:D-alanine-D-alanine ligase-like ATP-grasp enzyme